MSKLIVTTSWDDGQKTDLKLAELLAKYGIKGTFYLTQSYRDEPNSLSLVKRKSRLLEESSLEKSFYSGALETTWCEMWRVLKFLVHFSKHRVFIHCMWTVLSGAALCIHKLGIFRWYSSRNHIQGTLILCYHQMEAAVLRKHIEYLKNHFNLISLDDLVKSISEGITLEDTMVITFDDGHKSIYTDIFPLIKLYNMPIAIFLVSDIVGTGREIWTDTVRNLKNTLKDSVNIPDVEYFKCLPDEQRNKQIEDLTAKYGYTPTCRNILSWSEVQEMLDSGLVSIGSHSKTHPCLTMMKDEDAQEEIVGSKSDLESRLNIKIKHFCYPNGDYENSHLEMVRGVYSSASTMVPGVNNARTDPCELRRIDAKGNVGILAMKMSGLWGRLGLDWFILEYMRKRALLKLQNQEVSRHAKQL